MKSTVFLFLEVFSFLSPSTIFTHPPAAALRLGEIKTEFNGLSVEVDDLELDGLDLNTLGLEVDGLEVDGLEVDGLEVDGLEVEVIEVDGLEVDVTNDLEVVGLDTLD